MCEQDEYIYRPPPDPCATPAILPRNGMDYQKKKKCPIDNPIKIDVRDWQMSPFGKERFDMDEIARAHKKGIKGRAEYLRLRKLYLGDDCGVVEEKEKDPCEECMKRKEEEAKKSFKCSDKLMYQPYGPTVVYSTSYSRPECPKPRFYSYLDPAPYSSYKFTVLGPELSQSSTCADYEEFPARNFKQVYRPYGPYGEMRLTPNLYVPLGPKVHCPDKCP